MPVRRCFLATLVLLALEALAGYATVAGTDPRQAANNTLSQRPCRPPRELRVRKELRRLTPDEYRMYVTGFATMMSVGTEQGQKLFGPKWVDHPGNAGISVHANTCTGPHASNPKHQETLQRGASGLARQPGLAFALQAAQLCKPARPPRCHTADDNVF